MRAQDSRAESEQPKAESRTSSQTPEGKPAAPPDRAQQYAQRLTGQQRQEAQARLDEVCHPCGALAYTGLNHSCAFACRSFHLQLMMSTFGTAATSGAGGCCLPKCTIQQSDSRS